MSDTNATTDTTATDEEPTDEHEQAQDHEHEHEQDTADDVVTKAPIEQPEPDSRLRRLAKNTPFGPDEYEGTQAEIGVTNAYSHEHAVQRDDGALLGAIRVRPANMATKDEETWRKTVNDLARTLAAEVDYHVQWFNSMRSVDYENRRQKYLDQAYELGQQANLHGRTEYQILADICDERAQTVDLLQETTLTREFYIVVAVEPEEAVVSLDDDEGLTSIPMIGDKITQQRLAEQEGSDEHLRDMLDTLDSRVSSMSRAIRTLDGIKTQPLSSGAFSQVIADYYRGEDVYSYADFTAQIRETPVPVMDGEEGPDPEYTVSYDHLEGGSGIADRAATADGGTIPAVPPALNGNGDATANIALTDEDLKQHYRTRLAPDELDARPADHITLDREWCSMTLVIREWPNRPPLGMLEDILNYDQPGLRVTVSTHFEGLDIGRERRRLKSTVQSLGQKRKSAENRGSPLEEKRRREHEAARDVKESIENTDAGLFATNTYIELRAPSQELIDEAARQIKSRLKELNANVKPFSYAHETGYKTAAPLARDTGYDSVKMLGSGLAALIPWTSHNLIEPGGVEIGTHADRCEPTVLDLWNRDTGYNVGIFGTIGSGKTTTLKKLLMRLKLTNDDFTLVLTDPLEEFAGMCETFRGKRVVIGGETSINPLHIEPTPEEKLSAVGGSTPFKDANRRFISFIETFYDLENLDLGKKRGVWQLASKRAYRNAGITRDPATHGNESPTLADVLDVLYDTINSPEEYVNAAIDEDEDAISDLKSRAIAIVNSDIGPFREGGVYHHLTGPTDIDISESDVLYLDLQNYEGEQKTGLMMQLLVSQVYEQAKVSPNPTIMAMDESHYMLKNSTDLAFLKQAVRHSRHHDLSMMFSTQSVGEFFADQEDGSTELTNDAKIIIDNMSVQIFHYLKEMNEEWASEFGLSQNEMEYIQAADPGSEAAGYSEALLSVDTKGSYPIRVEMSQDLNPLEFALNQYDPSDHDHDGEGGLEAYLKERAGGWSWTAGR
jgi:Cdc6-like AAA superfamily ATPase